MNKQDREDVLLIVEAVLDNYLAPQLVKDICKEVDQSIRDNWWIFKAMHEREQGGEALREIQRKEGLI